jgi:hypothetical protein
METQLEPNSTDDTTKATRQPAFRVLFYSVIAVVIFFAGKFSWWLALVLFVFFAFYIFLELLVTGLVLVIVAFILRKLLPFLTSYRVLRSDKFDELQKVLGSLGKASGVTILIQLYFVVITLALGYYLFFKS